MKRNNTAGAKTGLGVFPGSVPTSSPETRRPENYRLLKERGGGEACRKSPFHL
jgi:hypothetical protein